MIEKEASIPGQYWDKSRIGQIIGPVGPQRSEEEDARWTNNRTNMNRTMIDNRRGREPNIPGQYWDKSRIGQIIGPVGPQRSEEEEDRRTNNRTNIMRTMINNSQGGSQNTRTTLGYTLYRTNIQYDWTYDKDKIRIGLYKSSIMGQKQDQ